MKKIYQKLKPENTVLKVGNLNRFLTLFVAVKKLSRCRSPHTFHGFSNYYARLAFTPNNDLQQKVVQKITGIRISAGLSQVYKGSKIGTG
jgi:hypothetical protein